MRIFEAAPDHTANAIGSLTKPALKEASNG